MITFEIVYKFGWLNDCYDLVNSFSHEIEWISELLKEWLNQKLTNGGLCVYFFSFSF